MHRYERSEQFTVFSFAYGGIRTPDPIRPQVRSHRSNQQSHGGFPVSSSNYVMNKQFAPFRQNFSRKGHFRQFKESSKDL